MEIQQKHGFLANHSYQYSNSLKINTVRLYHIFLFSRDTDLHAMLMGGLPSSCDLILTNKIV